MKLRKYWCLLVLIFLFCFQGPLSAQAKSEFEYVGAYKSHQQDDNKITFTCNNAIVLVELCKADVLRVRMRKEGAFLPNEPWVVIKYDWPKVDYKLVDEGSYLALTTAKAILEIHKKPFRLEFNGPDGDLICDEPEKGGMGFRGDEVICRKQLRDSNHLFGMGQHYQKSDLRGTKTRLWTTENQTYIPFFMSTDGYGIFFHNTWPVTFDFTGDPYSFSSPGGKELDYYFMYGTSFKHILGSYTEITGRSPLPPKWAFGTYMSKWDKQNGQKGLTDHVRQARGEKQWPLDAIRIHSKGCSQNIWTGADTNLEDAGWGSFPTVDKMIKEFQAQNVHPVFWEGPGIMNGCQMYDQGEEEGYYIMENDEVWDGGFGSGLHGALIDFCNPAARKWWAELHHPLIDMGSDGAAGDHGEEMKGKMYSPYSKMTGQEYHNIYSMLYDKASWDAYRKRMPNKRCIVFGRSLGPGCQRYPMQGTKDSHEVGKNIFGEVMGCINFGLSGVPFRTFTDNVTRSLNFEKDPIIRLSQYLSLGVAGERTEVIWTGNKTADDNYRFYAKLRYRLMPYIYTYARITTQTGLPLVRALVLEYQYDPKTYTAYCQYLMGKDIMIAPLWSDKAFSRELYLPSGKWIDFWDDTVYKGNQTISYDAPIDKVPILVKAGAIIPMAPDGQLYVDQKLSPLTIRIYPKRRSKFELYEDDGKSYDYEKGIFALTTFKCRNSKDEMFISKSKPQGCYKIPQRDHIFSVHLTDSAKSVACNGKAMNKVSGREQIESVASGWFHDATAKVLWIKIAGGVEKKFEIRIKK